MKVLGSYHYFRTVDVAEKVNTCTSSFPDFHFFADSGAWSALTLGKPIKLDEYLGWIDRWRASLFSYCALDDMTSPEQSHANVADHKRRGQTPLPVVHMGEPDAVLQRYLDEGYDYIGLGRMVGRQTKPVMRWLVHCFQMAAAYPAVRFHGFGLTRPEVIEQLPFYSVDSSSWAGGHRFGVLFMWNGHGLKHQLMWDIPKVYRWREELRAAGFDPREFTDKDHYTNDAAAAFNAITWTRFEQHVRKIHGPISAPTNPAPATADPGLHLYLSSIPNDLDRLINVRDRVVAGMAALAES